MVAGDARGAAKEALAGDPGPAGRRRLLWVSLLALGGFAIDSYLVLSGLTLSGFDEPIARAVQSFNWGLLAPAMDLTNTTGGVKQDLFGVAVVIALFSYDRRAGLLMALGALGSLIDQVAKILIERHRPTTDLVTILYGPSSGYSYPSGHAVFFTWLSFMLAASLSPRLRPAGRAVAWGLAAMLIFTACLGRVWAGAHWPSDVIGGFLLGLGWSAFVLWLPERWLPRPGWRWFRGGRALSHRA